MTTLVSGVVKNGLIVPSSPLPEGARVEILVAEARLDISADLQAEFEAWDRSSSDALALVEQLAIEGESNEAR
jgi:hypothetical protein